LITTFGTAEQVDEEEKEKSKFQPIADLEDPEGK
jgi:hypothetical protein